MSSKALRSRRTNGERTRNELSYPSTGKKCVMEIEFAEDLPKRVIDFDQVTSERRHSRFQHPNKVCIQFPSSATSDLVGLSDNVMSSKNTKKRKRGRRKRSENEDSCGDLASLATQTSLMRCTCECRFCLTSKTNDSTSFNTSGTTWGKQEGQNQHYFRAQSNEMPTSCSSTLNLILHQVISLSPEPNTGAEICYNRSDSIETSGSTESRFSECDGGLISTCSYVEAREVGRNSKYHSKLSNSSTLENISDREMEISQHMDNTHDIDGRRASKKARDREKGNSIWEKHLNTAPFRSYDDEIKYVLTRTWTEPSCPMLLLQSDLSITLSMCSLPPLDIVVETPIGPNLRPKLDQQMKTTTATSSPLARKRGRDELSKCFSSPVPTVHQNNQMKNNINDSAKPSSDNKGKNSGLFSLGSTWDMMNNEVNFAGMNNALRERNVALLLKSVEMEDGSKPIWLYRPVSAANAILTRWPVSDAKALSQNADNKDKRDDEEAYETDVRNIRADLDARLAAMLTAPSVPHNDSLTETRTDEESNKLIILDSREFDTAEITPFKPPDASLLVTNEMRNSLSLLSKLPSNYLTCIETGDPLMLDVVQLLLPLVELAVEASYIAGYKNISKVLNVDGLLNQSDAALFSRQDLQDKHSVSFMSHPLGDILSRVYKPVVFVKSDIYHRHDESSVPANTPPFKDDNTESTSEDRETKNMKLLRMIQFQIWLRMKVWSLHGKPGWDFLNFLATLMKKSPKDQSVDQGSRTNRKEGVKRGIKKSKSKSRRSQLKATVIEELKMLMEMVPYVLPPTLDFSSWVNDTLTFGFKRNMPDYGGDLLDYFEIENVKPLPSKKNCTDRSQQPRKSYDLFLQKDSSSSGILESDRGSGDLKFCVEKRQQRQQKFFSYLAEESLSSPTDGESTYLPSDTSRAPSLTTTSSSTIATRSNEEEDQYLLRKPYNLTAATRTRNPFLKGNARGVYVGSHLGSKLSNISTLFHEVTVPNRPKTVCCGKGEKKGIGNHDTTISIQSNFTIQFPNGNSNDQLADSPRLDKQTSVITASPDLTKKSPSTSSQMSGGYPQEVVHETPQKSADRQRRPEPSKKRHLVYDAGSSFALGTSTPWPLDRSRSLPLNVQHEQFPRGQAGLHVHSNTPTRQQTAPSLLTLSPLKTQNNISNIVAQAAMVARKKR